MKKVLFITNYPSPYRVEFFELLGKFTKLTVAYEEKAEEQIHRNQKWFEHNYKNFNAYYLNALKLGKKRISFDVINFLKKQYDYVIICGYSSLTLQLCIMYMKMFNKCFYLEIDGGYPKSGKGIKENWKRILVSSAQKWFSPSVFSDKYLEFYGAKKEQIVRYPFTSLSENDILKERITKTEKENIKEQLGIKEEKVVLTIGQFIYRKGNDVLIQSAIHYEKENVGTYIIGGVPPKEYTEMVQELNLKNIHFVEFKKKEQLMLYYKAADVFVMPTREDIWGLVINEALASGLPVVSTDKCVAAIELIKDGKNGFLVESDNSYEIANKINFLLSNSELCQKMGQESLERIKNHTIEEMVKVHLNVFN